MMNGRPFPGMNRAWPEVDVETENADKQIVQWGQVVTGPGRHANLSFQSPVHPCELGHGVNVKTWKIGTALAQLSPYGMGLIWHRWPLTLPFSCIHHPRIKRAAEPPWGSREGDQASYSCEPVLVLKPLFRKISSPSSKGFQFLRENYR